MSDLLGMKRMYSTIKIDEILGPYVTGLEMPSYGLPSLTHRGVISEVFETGSVGKMLAQVQLHPDIHVVTFLKNGDAVNKFQAHNAQYYKLYKGDADPEIEFIHDYDASLQFKKTMAALAQIMANPEKYLSREAEDYIVQRKREILEGFER